MLSHWKAQQQMKQEFVQKSTEAMNKRGLGHQMSKPFLDYAMENGKLQMPVSE